MKYFRTVMKSGERRGEGEGERARAHSIACTQWSPQHCSPQGRCDSANKFGGSETHATHARFARRPSMTGELSRTRPAQARPRDSRTLTGILLCRPDPGSLHRNLPFHTSHRIIPTTWLDESVYSHDTTEAVRKYTDRVVPVLLARILIHCRRPVRRRHQDHMQPGPPGARRSRYASGCRPRQAEFSERTG